MKKLLFVLAFTFIGQQAFSQMYIVTLTKVDASHPSGCQSGGGNELVLTKIDPTGNATYTCIINSHIPNDPNSLIELNQQLNNIINQGYKMIYTSSTPHNGGGLVSGIYENSLAYNTIWYFTIP
jgi:hypothetical protein